MPTIGEYTCTSEYTTESANERANECENWAQFLEFAKKNCSATAFENWLAPIHVIDWSAETISLEVPNVFVKEYLLDNYKNDLRAFLPVNPSGEPSINFTIGSSQKAPSENHVSLEKEIASIHFAPIIDVKLNNAYRFDTFIEGPSNQFAKSAAMGVANRPGRSYNPLFIHGGVGLGKTHLLHGIGHYIQEHHKKTRIQSITTEGFCNDLVDNLRNKSVDQMKKRYREADVFLLDDVQFLQSRLNFEEELCNTFESLINQNRQIVITSDKPPSQLKLSERIVARMEWGLVVHVGMPELETRVAILQHKAEQKGMHIPNKVLFFIAEHIYSNVRQLEGALNRLSAQCRLLNLDITEELVEQTLREMLQQAPKNKISVENILKSVAAVFQVKVSDIKGSSRTKEVVLPRQVAMYLAREMISESLIMLGAYFNGRTHSTFLHACKNIEKKAATDEMLRKQISMVRQNIET
ncbi:MAG: chromosomal replication initiator protein DnaA [Chlamydiales bacterium]|nr:chromosomal replication initiator protein DnaA [Chlamydiales bacterium]